MRLIKGKKGQKMFGAIMFFIFYWAILLMLGKYTLVNLDRSYDPNVVINDISGFEAGWMIITVQIPGVPWFFQYIFWAMSTLGIILGLLILKGLFS